MIQDTQLKKEMYRWIFLNEIKSKLIIPNETKKLYMISCKTNVNNFFSLFYEMQVVFSLIHVYSLDDRARKK